MHALHRFVNGVSQGVVIAWCSRWCSHILIEPRKRRRIHVEGGHPSQAFVSGGIRPRSWHGSVCRRIRRHGRVAWRLITWEGAASPATVRKCFRMGSNEVCKPQGARTSCPHCQGGWQGCAWLDRVKRQRSEDLKEGGLCAVLCLYLAENPAKIL